MRGSPSPRKVFARTASDAPEMVRSVTVSDRVNAVEVVAVPAIAAVGKMSKKKNKESVLCSENRMVLRSVVNRSVDYRLVESKLRIVKSVRR